MAPVRFELDLGPYPQEDRMFWTKRRLNRAKELSNSQKRRLTSQSRISGFDRATHHLEGLGFQKVRLQNESPLQNVMASLRL
jgi:hypothetical protein